MKSANQFKLAIYLKDEVQVSWSLLLLLLLLYLLLLCLCVGTRYHRFSEQCLPTPNHLHSKPATIHLPSHQLYHNNIDHSTTIDNSVTGDNFTDNTVDNSNQYNSNAADEYFDSLVQAADQVSTVTGPSAPEFNAELEQACTQGCSTSYVKRGHKRQSEFSFARELYNALKDAAAKAAAYEAYFEANTLRPSDAR
ncbi:hypothetical protein BJY04DRAFT_69161 [Aspergillus karnatakaensis]|uniref:uncharacterized protein n=1 Tax=Aspergillus karnatakaensis TaxID=1810916 RepID=UPI003CCCBC64